MNKFLYCELIFENFLNYLPQFFYKCLGLQFNFVVTRASSGKGYVAIDVVEFKFVEEECAFFPPDAKPVPTTTAPPPTTIPTTTIEPTEPPDCKLCLAIILGSVTYFTHISSKF